MYCEACLMTWRLPAGNVNSLSAAKHCWSASTRLSRNSPKPKKNQPKKNKKGKHQNQTSTKKSKSNRNASYKHPEEHSCANGAENIPNSGKSPKGAPTMGKDKLPKAAVADLVECAKEESKYTKVPAPNILKHYITLMDKYRSYFFDSPWPQEFKIEDATTFTETDINFLAACTEEDYLDRLETMYIKKNLYQTGIMAWGKMFWTPQAFQKELDKVPDDS